MGIVILVVTFGLMYVLFILPQQRKARAHRGLVASLAEGDEVVTSAGIYGTVTLVDGEVILLEVADDVELRVAKSAIGDLVEYEDEDEDEEIDVDGADASD